MADGQSSGGAAPGGPKIFVDRSEVSIEQLAARDHDEIDADPSRQRLVQSEDLSNQSFSAISMDGVAKLARGDDPESYRGARLRGQQQSEITRADPDPIVEDCLEVFPPSHPLPLAEAVRWHRMAGASAWRPSAACAPSRDGV